MTRDIRRRLEKLESQLPRQETAQERAITWSHDVLLLGVAHYLGDPDPEESVFDAYMRVLGYPHSFEFRNALEANDEDFNRRRLEAIDKLLAKFGVSRTDKWETFVDTLGLIKDGLSERYKEILADRKR